MARPKGTTDPAVTRARLVEAATRRFSADGYAWTSLAQIARDAGMTAPSLLYHYPSKDDLFNEVLRGMWRGIRHRLLPILEQDTDAETMLARAVQALLGVEQEQPTLFTQLHAALLAGDGIGAAAVNDTLLPLIDEIEAAICRAAGTSPADA